MRRFWIAAALVVASSVGVVAGVALTYITVVWPRLGEIDSGAIHPLADRINQKAIDSFLSGLREEGDFFEDDATWSIIEHLHQYYAGSRMRHVVDRRTFLVEFTGLPTDARQRLMDRLDQHFRTTIGRLGGSLRGANTGPSWERRRYGFGSGDGEYQICHFSNGDRTVFVIQILD